MTHIKNKIFCFLGLPGSGKGTQIEILQKKINAKIISIGDEIRDEIEESDLSDPFYQEMKKLYDQGIPQSDEVVIDIVKKRIKHNNNLNLIFDNFPFSKNQAELFFKICHELEVNYPELVLIDITTEESIKRVVYRRICADCDHISSDPEIEICDKCGGAMIARVDDNEETVRQRIKNYLPRILEVEHHFKQHGKVHKIDGSASIESVAESIERAIF